VTGISLEEFWVTNPILHYVDFLLFWSHWQQLVRLAEWCAQKRLAALRSDQGPVKFKRTFAWLKFFLTLTLKWSEATVVNFWENVPYSTSHRRVLKKNYYLKKNCFCLHQWIVLINKMIKLTKKPLNFLMQSLQFLIPGKAWGIL
jgi:hypothetical protein